MCNRSIKIEDIDIMKEKAWDLKTIILERKIKTSMSTYPADHYLKKKE